MVNPDVNGFSKSPQQKIPRKTQ